MNKCSIEYLLSFSLARIPFIVNDLHISSIDINFITSIACSLYSFQTDQPSVVGVSYIQLREKNIPNFYDFDNENNVLSIDIAKLDTPQAFDFGRQCSSHVDSFQKFLIKPD